MVSRLFLFIVKSVLVGKSSRSKVKIIFPIMLRGMRLFTNISLVVLRYWTEYE